MPLFLPNDRLWETAKISFFFKNSSIKKFLLKKNTNNLFNILIEVFEFEKYFELITWKLNSLTNSETFFSLSVIITGKIFFF